MAAAKGLGRSSTLESILPAWHFCPWLSTSLFGGIYYKVLCEVTVSDLGENNLLSHFLKHLQSRWDWEAFSKWQLIHHVIIPIIIRFILTCSLKISSFKNSVEKKKKLIPVERTSLHNYIKCLHLFYSLFFFTYK